MSVARDQDNLFIIRLVSKRSFHWSKFSFAINGFNYLKYFENKTVLSCNNTNWKYWPDRFKGRPELF